MSEPSEAETTAITPSITLLINAICTRKNFQNVGELDWHEFVPFCHHKLPRSRCCMNLSELGNREER